MMKMMRKMHSVVSSGFEVIALLYIMFIIVNQSNLYLIHPTEDFEDYSISLSKQPIVFDWYQPFPSFLALQKGYLYGELRNMYDVCTSSIRAFGLVV